MSAMGVLVLLNATTLPRASERRLGLCSVRESADGPKKHRKEETVQTHRSEHQPRKKKAKKKKKNGVMGVAHLKRRRTEKCRKKNGTREGGGSGETELNTSRCKVIGGGHGIEWRKGKRRFRWWEMYMKR